MSLEHLLGMSLADAERALILQTLEDCGGNRTRAAKRLQVSVRTLRNKINIYKDQGCDVHLPSDLDKLAAKTEDGPGGRINA
jgi:two-component system, response regulator FlrC